MIGAGCKKAMHSLHCEQNRVLSRDITLPIATVQIPLIVIVNDQLSQWLKLKTTNKDG
jgi:hypothetical protein